MEIFRESIDVEKDLRAIRVIVDDELTKDSKDMGRRSQATVSKEKEKEESEIEKLIHLIKSLTTKVSKLKKPTSETTVNNRPRRFM